jgi:hypothetical protein
MKRRLMTASLLLLCAFAPAAAQSPNVTPPPVHPPPTPQTPQPAQTPTPTRMPHDNRKQQPTPTPTTAEPKVSPEEATKKYEAMLQRAKKGEGEIDYRALRFAFYETPAYNPLSGMLAYRSLWGALAQSNWAEAAKTAEAVLSKSYVDINAHMVAHIAYREQGNEEKAKLHRRWAEGLIASVMAGGDGKTPATAWHVISTSEEYAVLRWLNLRPAGQALIHADGHSYDEMTVVDAQTQTQAQSKIYFNVDRPFSAYGRK